MISWTTIGQPPYKTHGSKKHPLTHQRKTIYKIEMYEYISDYILYKMTFDLENDSIYKLLGINDTLPRSFISIKPNLSVIKYDFNYNMIMVENKFRCNICYDSYDLILNRKESYIISPTNKKIVLNTNSTLIVKLFIKDNNTSFSISYKDANKTTTYYYDCDIFKYDLIGFQFNDNVIIGEKTLKILQEKGISIYYKDYKEEITSLFTSSIKIIRKYKFICNNEDNERYLTEVFSELGTFGFANITVLEILSFTKLNYFKMDLNKKIN
jgi:hypothetical protein